MDFIFCLQHFCKLPRNDQLPTPLHVFPYTGHLQGGWMDPQYLHFFWGGDLLLGFSKTFCFAFCTPFFDHTTSNSLLTFRLSNMTVLALCISILLAQVNTCSLVTELMWLIHISSCMVSTIKPSSFKLFLNCTFNCLSFFFICTFQCHYTESTKLLFCIFMKSPAYFTIL